MRSARSLGRWSALAAVIAGVSLFTLGLLGMNRLDSRLEVAATAQHVAAAKHKAAPARDRASERGHEGV